MTFEPLVNAQAAAVNKIIERLIFDVAVRTARAAAIAEAPWLGLPVISQVFDYLLNLFGKFIYEALARQATFTVIDSQVGKSLTEYETAVSGLNQAVAAGSAEDVDKAQLATKAALINLVRWDGDARIRL